MIRDSRDPIFPYHGLRRLWRTWFIVSLALLGCAEPDEGVSILGLSPLNIYAAGPTIILPATELELQGEGLLPEGSGTHTIWVYNNQGVNLLLEATLVNETTLRASLGPALEQLYLPQDQNFQVTLRVTRKSSIDDSEAWIEVPMTFLYTDQITPILTNVSTNLWLPGDSIYFQGDNLLRTEEGTASLFFTGIITRGSPPTEESVVDGEFSLTPLTRTSSVLTLNPDVLGIQPATVEGSFRIQNTPHGGISTNGAPYAPGLISYERPVLESVGPSVIRRGQTLVFQGRGFLPTTPEQEASSLILLDGILESTKGDVISYQQDNVMALFPDNFVDNIQMNYVLRITMNVDGKQEGLGIIPGVFKGTASPWILHGKETVLGTGIPLELTIAPQLQVIYIHYLPGYYSALERFGLANAAQWVKERILQVVHRDYTGINVAFTENPPTEFAEYGIVEVGGEDPNGAQLFGLDNTEGKDVGNIRFNDVIGGINAETAEDGYYAYGGIFVDSFMGLSPTLGISGLPITDTRFDQIFSPFSPELGGVPVDAEEVFIGPRSAAIAEAIRVLGNLIGNTITHEVGHSLGLSAIDGQFHNVGDNPAWIMDAGIYRPFAERSETDGVNPARFSPFNREYLEAVLPVE